MSGLYDDVISGLHQAYTSSIFWSAALSTTNVLAFRTSYALSTWRRIVVCTPGMFLRALHDRLPQLRRHDEGLAGFAPTADQERGEFLRLDIFHVDAVHHDDGVVDGFLGQRGFEREPFELLIDRVAVVARLGRKRYAAVRVMRHARGALTGAARTLLAVWLGAAAGDLGARKRRLRALTGVFARWFFTDS